MTAVSDRSPAPSGAGVPSADDDLLNRARLLQPLLRENAAEGERQRRTHELSLAACRDAGLLKVVQPRRYGGHQANMRTVLDITAAVGEGDGGTAWVLAQLNVCAWMLGTFPQQAQDDVWKSDRDALVSGVLATTADSRKVDGGLKVTGRWRWNSGSHHATWALLGVPIASENGEVVDQGLALIPRTDLGLEDTWFSAGMKSTGSNTLTAHNVFVPSHRIISVQSAIEGSPATEHTNEHLYRSAFVPVLALALAGPQLGLGRAALSLVRDKATAKPVSNTYYLAQADSVAFQLQLAEAAMHIDTAHLHAYRVADHIDHNATSGDPLDSLDRARARADVAWAINNVTKAIDLLLTAHGAGSFAETNPLQRIWRDSAVAARHAVAVPSIAYEVYGKALLDRTDQITPLV